MTIRIPEPEAHQRYRTAPGFQRMCERCGAIVGSMPVHDAAHHQQDMNVQVMVESLTKMTDTISAIVALIRNQPEPGDPHG